MAWLFVAISVSVALPHGPAAANPKYAAIVVDHKTGKVLFSRNADAARYPASLTKMMTVYIMFEELEAGRLKENTRMRVSKYAASQQPSKIYVKAGSTIRVKDAIRALVTKSANDVAVVVAEHISGSQKKFAGRMTRTAKSLGMSRTVFHNPHGLPDSRQRTTARDMATLGRALQDRFPKRFKVFSTRSFKYAGKTYSNHNRLLGRVRGVDGIKTGYIRASGFNLTTSVNHGGRRVVAVVMGGKSGKSRNAHMTNLIQRHFKKATRGRRTSALVLPKGYSKGRAAADFVRKAPVPRPAHPDRSEAPQSIEQLIAQTAKSPLLAISPTHENPVSRAFSIIDQPLPRPTGSMSDAISNYVAQHHPSAEARQAIDGLLTGSISADATADDDERASFSGWFVQIAASPTREKALTLLADAAADRTDLLESSTRMTETVVVDGTTLHRARFAGFETKSAANSACSSLRKADFECFVARH